jgi:DMSO/TMAO reductase YedYZ molybdopterin-dependent catalytic subunit
LATANPSQVDNSNLPVSPASDLHVEDTYGTQDVSIDDYTLSIYGLVDNPLDLTYDMFETCEKVSQVTLLICPGVFADNPEWSDVPVSTLLAAAGVTQEAQTATFHSVDGDDSDMPIADAMTKGVLLADEEDGLTLSASHGYPMRLVKPGSYGADWLKWVIGIEIT